MELFFFQEDIIGTSNSPAVGSCHAGAHLELLNLITQPGSDSGVPVTPEIMELCYHRIVLAPFYWDEGNGLQTICSDRGKWLGTWGLWEGQVRKKSDPEANCRGCTPHLALWAFLLQSTVQISP